MTAPIKRFRCRYCGEREPYRFNATLASDWRKALNEIDRQREDALRYRWLRDHRLHGVAHPLGDAIGMSEVIFGDDPDAAIDAAILALIGKGE